MRSTFCALALAAAFPVVALAAPAFTIQTVPTGNAMDNVVEISAADFNNDGLLDLAAQSPRPDPNSGIVIVYLNSGGTTFTPVTRLTNLPSDYGLVTGDFNEDGNQDVAIGTFQKLTVLPGNGAGGFGAPITTTYVPFQRFQKLAVADVNLDGNLDIVANQSGDAFLYVALGNGNGTFAPATLNYPSPLAHDAITVANLNNDAYPDVITLGINTDIVEVHLNNGSGGFPTATPYPTSPADQRPSDTTAGDLNGDGLPDLVIVQSGNVGGSLVVRLGTGGGAFGAPLTVPIAGGQPTAVTLGDYDLDGNLDVALTRAVANDVMVFSGNGDGTFQVPVTFPVGASPSDIITADWNDDNLPDLATANQLGSVSFLFNITPPVVTPVPALSTIILLLLAAALAVAGVMLVR